MKEWFKIKENSRIIGPMRGKIPDAWLFSIPLRQRLANIRLVNVSVRRTTKKGLMTIFWSECDSDYKVDILCLRVYV